MPRTINGRKKQQDFDIVVALDNNHYLTWQCLVFHHSCLTHLGRAPIIVVHGDGPLASGRIAREWAALTEDCLMTSFRHHGRMNSEVWISTMWAFVLVALRIDVPITVTAICVMNDRTEVNQTPALKNGQMVHYGYGDDFFNKKNYMNEDDSLNAVGRLVPLRAW